MAVGLATLQIGVKLSNVACAENIFVFVNVLAIANLG